MKYTHRLRRNMQIAKIRSYVGFAVKAGKAKIGVDNIISAKKTPYVILYDERLSQNSKEKLFRKCADKKIFPVSMEEVFPNKNCLAIGIAEVNLAGAISKEMEEIL